MVSGSKEGEGFDEVFSECGQQWVTQQVDEVLLSSLDTVGLHQHDMEVFLFAWYHNAVDNSGCFGKCESSLECDPLALWDPNEFRELLMDQEIAEGELGVAETKFKMGFLVIEEFLSISGFPYCET